MVGPDVQRHMVRYLQTAYNCSERKACATLSVNRCTARHQPMPVNDAALRARMKEIAEVRRRFGAPRIHVLLRREGLVVNHKRTERIYREENLSLRFRKIKKRFSRLRSPTDLPEGPDQKWGMDFVSDQLDSGRRIKILTIIDLWDRSSPALEVDLSISGQRVATVLEHLRIRGRIPKIIHVDNGPEFTSLALENWASSHGVKLEFSRPGTPTDNGHVESFNGRLRDECLNQHLFLSLSDARKRIDNWRNDYNENRPHSALNWMTPNQYRKKHSHPLPTESTSLAVA